MVSELCGFYKVVTFTMLLYGFVHPKSYTDVVASGRICKLCRLMVCMYSKLQIKSPWSLYDVDRDYDAISVNLLSLPIVSREVIGKEDILSIETLGKPAAYLIWNRNEYASDFLLRPNPVLRHGNFGDGSTI